MSAGTPTYIDRKFICRLDSTNHLNAICSSSTENTLHLKEKVFHSHVSSWNIFPTSTINIFLSIFPSLSHVAFSAWGEIFFFSTSALRHRVTAKANRFQQTGFQNSSNFLTVILNTSRNGSLELKGEKLLWITYGMI